MADTNSERPQGRRLSAGEWPRVSDSDGGGAVIFGRRSEAGEQWLPEPDVGRVAHGIPNRLDRLRALGNAVVPQVAEHVGRLILAADREAAA
jgi:hypothetical protein